MGCTVVDIMLLYLLLMSHIQGMYIIMLIRFLYGFGTGGVAGFVIGVLLYSVSLYFRVMPPIILTLNMTWRFC